MQQNQRVVSQVDGVRAIAGQQAPQLLARLEPVPIGLVEPRKEVLVVGSRWLALDEVQEPTDRGPSRVSVIPEGQDLRLGANFVDGLIGGGQVRCPLVDQVQQLERLERPAALPAGRQHDRQQTAGPGGIVGTFALEVDDLAQVDLGAAHRPGCKSERRGSAKRGQIVGTGRQCRLELRGLARRRRPPRNIEPGRGGPGRRGDEPGPGRWPPEPAPSDRFAPDTERE